MLEGLELVYSGAGIQKSVSLTPAWAVHCWATLALFTCRAAPVGSLLPFPPHPLETVKIIRHERVRLLVWLTPWDSTGSVTWEGGRADGCLYGMPCIEHVLPYRAGQAGKCNPVLPWGRAS